LQALLHRPVIRLIRAFQTFITVSSPLLKDLPNAATFSPILNKAEATKEDLMRPRYCPHDVIKRFDIFRTCHHL
jgi:hypothetical protein